MRSSKLFNRPAPLNKLSEDEKSDPKKVLPSLQEWAENSKIKSNDIVQTENEKKHADYELIRATIEKINTHLITLSKRDHRLLVISR